MLSTLLAINWEPEIRGVVVLVVAFTVFFGSLYLIISTNIGARLGFLVALAGLFGWLVTMGAIWWAYGIGLKGREASWKPAEPITIVRDTKYLPDAGVLDTIKVDSTASYQEQADATATALENADWNKLPESDSGRGQAIASADDIIEHKAEELKAGQYQAIAVYTRGGERFPKINDSLDFVAFLHKPHYAIVEIAMVKPQLSEPGRAPAVPVIDSGQPHRYVIMLRDLGSRRQPAMFITLGSGMIFGILCWLLHRRDQILAINRGTVNVPAKA